MPFYEYECENCKFYVELLQKVSDEPLKKCPSCKKNTIKKLVSAPVFRLKGSGWYETDFKGDKENKRNLAVEKDVDSSSSEDSKPAKAATASDAKAGEAKPAAAETAKSGESKSAESKTVSGGSSGSGSRKAAARSGAPAKSSRAPARPAAKAKPKAKAKAAARGRRR